MNDTTKGKWSLWTVRYTLCADPVKGRRWATNKSTSVIAESLIRATEIILARDPGAVVYGVSHHGQHEIIWGPEFAPPIDTAP